MFAIDIPYLLYSFKPPIALNQNSNGRVPQIPILRTVQNTEAVESTVLSPIQGYRVEVKNLLRSVTIDDVYVS